MRQKLVELVAVARLPTVYGIRDYPTAGGLMSYGPDQRQISRHAADYVDKLLKGATGRSPGRAADEIRVRYQSENGQSTRPQHSICTAGRRQVIE